MNTRHPPTHSHPAFLSLLFILCTHWGLLIPFNEHNTKFPISCVTKDLFDDLKDPPWDSCFCSFMTKTKHFKI